MFNVSKVLLLLPVISILGWAESWSGKLVDPECVDPAKSAAGRTPSCLPTSSTISFAVETPEGKVIKFDTTGNAKAREVLKTHGDPGLKITVTGKKNGDVVQVEKLQAE